MPNTRKNILITGASGMIGTALGKHLSSSGYQVYPLLRNRSDGPFSYDQQTGTMEFDPNIPLFGVINLAGANISDKRWNDARKHEIIHSREAATQLLSQTLAGLEHKPTVFLSASAIGYYGPTDTSFATESSSAGNDFLAEVAKRWEAATAVAEEAGIRTIHMRFGIVLSVTGGVLKNFILPLRLAVVGAVGDGNQKLSWISIKDTLRLIDVGLTDEKFTGPVNFVSNNAVSSREFSHALSKAAKRLRLPSLPATVVRVLFGEMADAALLASSDVRSQRYDELMFELEHQKLQATLEELLNNNL